MGLLTAATSPWQRQLLEFALRRRALVIKMAFPLAVASPVVAATPAAQAASALAMTIAIVASMGAAAVLARERAHGLQLRYRLLPCHPGRLLAERLAADALIDLLQLLPVLVLVASRGRVAWWPALALATVAVVLTGNLAGALASTLTEHPGEVTLYVLIALLPAFYLSGLFAAPTGRSLTLVSTLLPFTYLRQALSGALGAQPGLSPLSCALVAALFVAAWPAAAWLAGRRVLEAE